MHWEDLEGLGGEGGGRGDQDGEYMQFHGWFMSMYDKKLELQVEPEDVTELLQSHDKI